MGNSHLGNRKEDSAGFIEITNLRRSFYTLAFGAPYVLFPLLLSSARQAYAATADGAQQKDNIITPQRAATYMVGLLMCDETFFPAQTAETRGHYYCLNFSTGTIQLRTQIYVSFQRSTSFFNIRLEGSILKGEFVVRNAITDRVLVRVSEEQLNVQNFFSQELPFICCQAQNDPGLADSGTSQDLVEQSIELQLTIDNGGKAKTVQVIKKKGEQQGRVHECETGDFLCLIPAQSFNNLELLPETLRTMLASSGSRLAETPRKKP